MNKWVGLLTITILIAAVFGGIVWAYNKSIKDDILPGDTGFEKDLKWEKAVRSVLPAKKMKASYQMKVIEEREKELEKKPNANSKYYLQALNEWEKYNGENYISEELAHNRVEFLHGYIKEPEQKNYNELLQAKSKMTNALVNEIKKRSKGKSDDEKQKDVDIVLEKIKAAK